jgi:tripartite-type tricarboxylate transporter receptor subunit TctC
MTLRFLKSLAAVALACVAISAAAAYPEKPIMLVVPYAPGGMGTTFGNLLSEGLTALLGQNVVVDYKPGANGGLGAAAVARAPADGYTLLMAVNSTMAINPNLYPKLAYDPIKDFTPISMVFTSANVLVVNAASRYKSVADLIAYARAHPGHVNYGSSGNGATPHLSGELFRRLAGAPVVHIPYKGIGPALVDLMAGQVDFVFSDTSALNYVNAGKLRALAVTSPKRLGVAPQLPTMQELGLKGFVVQTWYSVVAPAGTPKDVVDRVNKALAKLLASPDFRSRLAAVGVDPAEDTSSEFLARAIRNDLAYWHKFTSVSAIRID